MPAVPGPGFAAALVEAGGAVRPGGLGFAALGFWSVAGDFFVGRAGELAVLEDLLAGVVGGVGGAVLVEGEQGIGKTALLVRALGGAGGAGCEVGWGVADEL